MFFVDGFRYLLCRTQCALVTKEPDLKTLKFDEVTAAGYKRIRGSYNRPDLRFPRAKEDWGPVVGLVVIERRRGVETPILYFPFEKDEAGNPKFIKKGNRIVLDPSFLTNQE